jgi:hypothetical protein
MEHERINRELFEELLLSVTDEDHPDTRGRFSWPPCSDIWLASYVRLHRGESSCRDRFSSSSSTGVILFECFIRFLPFAGRI